MTRHRRWTISIAERREADLFYADLVGEPLAPSPRPLFARSPAGLLQLPESSEDFGEQRRTTPGIAPTPRIATKWVGVDRRDIPARTVNRRQVADTAWMGTLLDNSNVRFTGAYVTGAPSPAVPADHFTGSSKAISRDWLPNIQTLANQGWGVVFFYVGYSVGGGESAPATGVDRARGVEHGRHLRETLHAQGPDWAGATVFIDNEDGESTPLPANLIEYYLGLFDEMSRPDRALAAFRPALYGHGQPVAALLERRRDLFVWDVNLDTSTTTTTTPPYALTADPIAIDSATRPIRAYQATPARGQSFISWPLGRQFRFYTGEMPSPASAIATRLPTWTRTTPWDYDVSFTRNPAFPVAEPRIAARQYVSASLVVADLFQARGQGAAATPPASRVIAQRGNAATAFTVGAGVTVEPDAPLTLFFRGGEMLLATVLSGGGIGVAAYDGLSDTWGAIERAGGAVPALRRLRALQGVSSTVSHTHLFYIGSDHRLYVKRQTRTPRGAWTAWSDGQPVNDTLRLHPFSGLEGVARRGDWVETFFIDERGLLASAWWSRGFTSRFPGFLIQQLETTPALLPGGALAAISPHPDHILVFGVGTDQRLRFTFFVAGQGWTGQAPVGTAQDLVGVHTRLAVHTLSASDVEVVALTDSGALAIYPFSRTGTRWAGGTRQVIVDPPAVATGPAVAGSAAGFRINPFGDLAILRPISPSVTTSVVYCAGVRGSESRTLRWNGAAAQPWLALTN